MVPRGSPTHNLDGHADYRGVVKVGELIDRRTGVLQLHSDNLFLSTSRSPAADAAVLRLAGRLRRPGYAPLARPGAFHYLFLP